MSVRGSRERLSWLFLEERSHQSCRPKHDFLLFFFFFLFFFCFLSFFPHNMPLWSCCFSNNTFPSGAGELRCAFRSLRGYEAWSSLQTPRTMKSSTHLSLLTAPVSASSIVIPVASAFSLPLLYSRPVVTIPGLCFLLLYVIIRLPCQNGQPE